MLDERREFQRLHLPRPVEASFGDLKVKILDVSAIGALVEHDGPLPVGYEEILRFVWRDSVVTMPAQVIRSVDRQSGLKFTEDSDLLRKLIADSAKEVLRAQVANLEGEREKNVIAGDETLTAASSRLMGNSGYLTLTFENGEWTRRKSLLPDQPENGFTISAAEPDDQVELLCKTYATGDDDARSMTRLLAELSCATVRGAS